MRIISGEKKGHKLIAPKGLNVRPTEDRIKESLFNILKPIKDNAIVLDLFAGSGSIAIEFLSRGSKLAYIIDIDPKSIVAIKSNLTSTSLLDRAVVLKNDGIKALEYIKGKGVRFDYIYLDPPYNDFDIIKKSLEIISKFDILAENGVIIVEHDNKYKLNYETKNLILYDFRKYGSKSLSFFRYKEV